MITCLDLGYQCHCFRVSRIAWCQYQSGKVWKQPITKLAEVHFECPPRKEMEKNKREGFILCVSFYCKTCLWRHGISIITWKNGLCYSWNCIGQLLWEKHKKKYFSLPVFFHCFKTGSSRACTEFTTCVYVSVCYRGWMTQIWLWEQERDGIWTGSVGVPWTPTKKRG